MYTVYPSEHKRWYLRLLLTHVAGSTSFMDLRTVNGVVYDTYRGAAMALGLLETNNHLQETLEEAMESQKPW